MSPRPKELNAAGAPKGGTCATKRTYTKRGAKAVAAAKRRSGVNVEAYHCAPCHCWHIGHPKGAHSNPKPGAPPG